MKVIEIENLTKYYGNFKALDGLSLSVNKGDIMGFIGPNGAGKTTTIRTLLGLLKKHEGTVEILGMDAWEDSVEIHKNLAYVPGDVQLWSNFTGGEIIDLLGSLRGSMNKKKRNELIKRFQLDPGKKFKTYSKGNRQKVALISALSSDVELYIFDEPTSGLDPLMEKVFQECILELKTEGKTILLSSHILAEVERLCNKIAIIKDGTIVETGEIHEMEHLKRIHVTLVAEDVKEALKNLIYVHNLKETDGKLEFEVDQHHINDLFRVFSRYAITSILCHPPKLEDIFINHYREEDAL
ncbi:ABC-2 type transport system ATP-binding protein [Natranaerovirga hydrolytica]|uniref:ABC-2 type transport system ATP-binding protein n=1 Tax=Natranaerovirga hydrolytica TaxID=680378 RepID=A0A4R1MIN6_9FIRM|nr:ABC transporter ATP-binding protein [Natranaerovirga hydrolytica]TCK92588.1 ABC-2 type transport system ATP-binding protein [Natranaerovirga hydrolytica]